VTTKELIALIRNTATSMGLDPNLATAIAIQESNFDSSSCRYEPNWSYFFQVDKFARKLNITSITEKQLQAFSWGCMQVMGSVARELGFEEDLPLLMTPENGVLYGCKKLKSLSNKYGSLTDVISSYNQGSPRKDRNGLYNNKNYVDSVLSRLNTLNKI
jgi:soluble lytic murein transglycosylase-like protein